MAPKEIKNPQVRRLPMDQGAEAATLGSMIVDPRCIADVIVGLDKTMFYATEHQTIYDAVIRLWQENRESGIDGLLVRAELERQGQLEAVGGPEYLQRVMDSVPSSANVEYYSQIVQEKSLLREVIQAGTDIVDDAYDETGKAREKLDAAEQKIFAITNKRVRNEAEGALTLVQQAFADIEQRQRGTLTGLGTGFWQLDDLTAGLQKGHMIVVAGRPSMGKTALALNIGEYVAVDLQIPVVVFSLEMGKLELTERVLCGRARVDAQLVRKGIVTTRDYDLMVEACNRIGPAPLYIDDSSGMTPLELRAKARRVQSRYDVKLVIVDYLQLMAVQGRREKSKEEETTEISRQVKGLARELQVPVILISQLNRSPETREGHRPRMSDLRNSGSIEQDADVVLLLHREDYYHSPDETGYVRDNTAEVIVAKQRNGPTGMVKLTFLDQYARFENQSVIEPGSRF